VSSSTRATESVVAVAVPVPGLGLLSYRIGGRLPPPRGARVRVPLGSRVVIGCVIGPAPEDAPREGLRDVVEVLDEAPFVPPHVVDLALWVGDYYASGPGDALAMAMPPASRKGDGQGFRTVAVAVLIEETSAGAVLKGARQREAIALLRTRPEGMTQAALGGSGISADTMRSLVRAGLVRWRRDAVERNPFEDDAQSPGGRWTLPAVVDDARALTDEQRRVLATLERAADAATFRTILVHGVTGSGKTEIYLRLASSVVRGGRRALVLVPEIALTPAVAGAFRAWFGSRVAIQHSALSDGERHDQWQRIRRGQIDVAVGTRSAVFAPLEGLGLIVVDEEHEGSYKQDESPRYHGRDVAVMRGRMEGVLVVLGSATPSLESSANARAGRYDLVRLTKRVLDRPLAAVRVVDMRPEYAASGPDIAFSRALIDALDARLTKGEQSLVLLNRRGFSTVIFCRECAASVECPHCSVVLTFHRAVRRVRCHYCNYSAPRPQSCGACGGRYLEQSGFGTERLEADLRARFPEARIARVDRDTIRRRGAIAGVLQAVARGEIDILVGTQMIAKGHDFPAVTLVGVVSADVGLGLADFRASERAFQLLTQVVGRAGRGMTPGEAIIQTLYPHHYSIRAAAQQDYDAFFEKEMEFRTSLQYPPVVALINVVVRGRTLDAVMTEAADLVARVRKHGPQGRVLGPAPAALQKIKDEYRAQFFVKGTRRKAMRTALDAALAERPDLRRRVVVDVDPVSVL
jgi:primosomal protein N' (replication factor Y)